MTTDPILGLLTGFVVGYLFIPFVILSGRAADFIWVPTEAKLNQQLSFTKGLTTLVLFVFLIVVLVVIGDVILKYTALSNPDLRGELGKFAALGIFVGVLTYAIVPSIERKLRRRSKKR